MSVELFRAKEAIFKLINQFQHAVDLFHDGELYVYNYCESALEAAFSVLGIEENYIKLRDFCQMWEDNNRAIWEIAFPDEPFGGVTADIYYQCFKEDYESWLRCIDE